MLDWLQDSFANGGEVPAALLVARLMAAFVLGCVVAGVYFYTRRSDKNDAASFIATLVLLSVLIAMVTVVIGNSVARAFSLVGALAIVRFRTVVEDTRDTAFVIFSVVVGMAAGAGNLLVPLVGIPIVAVAAFVFRSGTGPPPPQRGDSTLTIRVGLGREPHALFKEVFAKYLDHFDLIATSTARQGAVLELTYAIALRAEDGALRLVSELNQIEGVQGVELRRQ